MSFKIEGAFEGKIEVKRFCMPGVLASDECPQCNRKTYIDYNHEYLSFPLIGKPVLIRFYCNGCDQEWLQKAEISIQITALQEKK